MQSSVCVARAAAVVRRAFPANDAPPQCDASRRRRYCQSVCRCALSGARAIEYIGIVSMQVYSKATEVWPVRWMHRHTYVKLFAYGVVVVVCVRGAALSILCAPRSCLSDGNGCGIGWERKREPHNVCFNNFILFSPWRRSKCTRHHIRTSQLERGSRYLPSGFGFFRIGKYEMHCILDVWQNISSRFLLFFRMFCFASSEFVTKILNSRHGKTAPKWMSMYLVGESGRWWCATVEKCIWKIPSQTGSAYATQSNHMQTNMNATGSGWFRVQCERRRCQRVRRVSPWICK